MNKLDSIDDFLAEIEGHIKDKDKFAPKVSQRTIGWQLHHTLMVITSISNAVSQSDPSKKEGKSNMNWFIIKTLNKIPRGKGKAPKITTTEDPISMQDLESMVKKARDSWKLILKAGHDQYFKHPVFGILNTENAKKMIHIHTEHHLKIVRDIQKSK